MSNIFKRIFSLSKSSNLAQSSTSTTNADNHNDKAKDNDPQEEIVEDIDFSNDKDGLRMREEWIKYSNAAYERQQVDQALIDSYFLKFCNEFYDIYCNYIKLSDNISDTSSNVSNIIGHPIPVVIELALRLLSYLQVEDQNERGVHKVTFNFDLNSPSSEIFLTTLKCLSIITYWHHNSKVLVLKVGKNFVSTLFGVLEHSINNLNVIVSNLSELSEDVEKKASFLLKSIEYVTVMTSCSYSKYEYSIDLVLPTQPWIDRDLDKLGLMKLDEANSHFIDCISSTGRMSSTSQPSKVSGKSKQNMWCKVIQEFNCMHIIISYIQEVCSMQNLISNLMSCESNPDSLMIPSLAKSLLIILIESLRVLLLTINESFPRSINKFRSYGGEAVINCIFAMYPPKSPCDNYILTLLICRRNLLVLEIYKFIRKESVTKTSYPLFAEDMIYQWFSWVRQAIDIDAFDDPSTQLMIEMIMKQSLQCRSLISFQSDSEYYDLWPWMKDSDTRKVAPLWRHELLDYRLNSCYISNSRSGERDLWFRRGSSGMIWQALFDAYFDHMLLGHQHDHPADDLVPNSLKKNDQHDGLTYMSLLKTVCLSISSLIQSNRDRNLSDNSFRMPTFELHSLLFLTRCLRYESETTSMIIQQSGMINLLVQDSYLSRDNAIDLSCFTIEASEDLYDNMSSIQLKPTTIMGVKQLAYLSVNDCVLVFLNEYFSFPSNAVLKSWQPTNEMMSIVPALFNSSNNMDQYPDHYILQITRFYHRIFVGYSYQLDFQGLPRLVMISIAENLSKMMSDLGLSVTMLKSKLDGSKMVNIDKQRPFLWSARSSILSLLLWLSSNAFGKAWIDVLAGNLKLPSIDTRSVSISGKDALNDSRSSSLFGMGEVNLDIMISNDIDETNMDNKSIQNLLPTVIIDPRLRCGVISIVLNLLTSICMESKDITHRPSLSTITTSASTTSLASAAMNSNKQSEKNAMTLSLEQKAYLEYFSYVCKMVLEMGINARSYSSQCDILNTFLLFLRAITGLLRNDAFYTIRSNIQECIQKSGFLSTMIVAICGSCRHNSKSSRVKTQQDIMRQGLSLCTAMMANNQSIRHDIDAMLFFSSQSREMSNIKRLSISSSKQLSKLNSIPNSIKTMILQVEPSPSRETIIVLFEMMLEQACISSQEMYESSSVSLLLKGLFIKDDDKPKIINTKLIHFLFQLFHQCIDEVQSFILHSFYNLISGRASLVNMSTCSLISPSLFDISLNLISSVNESIQIDFIDLMTILGRYNMSVSQMKQFFYLLQSRSNHTRPACLWRLIQALRVMFTAYDGPKQSFIFDYFNSGLLLPHICRWPSRKGLTISLWFRVEAPKVSQRRTSYFTTESMASDKQHPSTSMKSDRIVSMNLRMNDSVIDGKSYTPYLFCFRNSTTKAGLEIILRPSGIIGSFSITVNYHKEDGTVLTFAKDNKGLIATDSRWHYLAISMQFSASGYSQKPDTSILLDDQFVKEKFLIPELPNDIQEPMIGDCPSPLKVADCTTTLRGQMGAIYFFNDALSEGQLKGIKALGPTYFHCFESYTSEYRDVARVLSKRKDTVDPSSILDGNLSSQIILTYNPAVWSNDYFLDNTPPQNNVKWKIFSSNYYENISKEGSVRINAKKIGSTSSSMKQDVRVAIDALGGVAAILPLFRLIDLPRIITMRSPIMSPSSNIISKFNFDSKIDETVDMNIFTAILELLVTVLEHNTIENKTMLRQLSGFNVIASFFEEVSSAHYTSEVLDLIILLFHQLKWDNQSQEGILDHVLCNFNIWCQTSEELQLKLLEWLTSFQHHENQRFRQVMNMNRILHTLYAIYEYDRNYSLSYAEEILKDDSKDNISSSQEDAKSLYQILLLDHSDISHDRPSDVMTSKLSFQMPLSPFKFHNLSFNSLKSVRDKFLTLIRQGLIVDGVILPENIKSLVSYIITVQSPISKLEGINLLRQLINYQENPSLPAYTLLGLAYNGCLQSLCLLLSHDHWQVRLNVFLVLLKSITLSTAFRLLPSTPTNSTYPSAINHIQSVSKFNPDSIGYNNMNPIGPSISFGSDSSRSFSSSMPYAHTLNALGFEPNNLVGIFTIINKWLLKSIQSIAGKYQEKDLFIQWYCHYILLLYQICLYGMSFSDMETILDEMVSEDMATGSLSQSFLTSKSERLKSIVIHVDNAKICTPQIFAAIFLFLKDSFTSIALKVSVLVSLKASLSDINNCDQILRIPQWQDYIVQLIADTTTKMTLIKISDQDKSSENDRIIQKSEALIEVSFRLICDLISTAITIGKPVNIEPDIIRLEEAKDRQISIAYIFSRFKSGDRSLGMCVFLEIMSILRSYGAKGSIELVKYLNGLCLYTAETLKSNILQILSCHRTDPWMDLDAVNRKYESKLCYLNVWLFASSYLDFLTEPLVQGLQNSDSNIKSTYIDLSTHFADIIKPLDSLFEVYEAYKHHKVTSSDTTSNHNWLYEQNPYSIIETDQSSPKISSKLLNVSVIYRHGGLHWLLLRIATSILVLGKLSNSQQIPAHQEILGKCLRYLSILLDDGSRLKADYMEFECLYAISSIYSSWMKSSDESIDTINQSNDLTVPIDRAKDPDYHNDSNDPKNSTVIIDSKIFQSIELFYSLLVNHSSLLQNLLLTVEEDTSDDNTASRYSVLSRFSMMNDIREKLRTRTASDIHSSFSKKLSVCQPTNDEPKTFANTLKSIEEDLQAIGTYPSISMSQFQEITIEQIFRTVGVDIAVDIDDPPGQNEPSDSELLVENRLIPKHSIRNQIWLKALEHIEELAQRIEHEATNIHLQSLGLSKMSFAVAEKFIQYYEAEKNQILEWTMNCAKVWDNLLDLVVRSLRESLEAKQLFNTAINRMKMGLFHVLENERGPWGDLNALEINKENCFWQLDMTRTNQFINPRLCRNNYGSRHTVASQRAALGRGNVTTDRTKSDDSNRFSTDQQILKDVFKFKANPLAKTIVSDKNDESNDDADESIALSIIESTNPNSPSAVLFTCDVEIITLATNSSGARNAGTITLSKTHLSYNRTNENDDFDFTNRSGNKEYLWACKLYPSSIWKLNDIIAVVRRRYQLREVGMEILFSSRSILFLNFKEINNAIKFYKILNSRGRCVNLMKGYFSLTKINMNVFSNSLFVSSINTIGTTIMEETTLQGAVKALSQAWSNREISNFDYLMYLNILAGRSFNDLSQYPVFPWVIADYTSNKLDLRDPKTYRDFRWPIGAQTETQRRLLADKFEAIASMDDCPPYHYGSHYSTAGFVIWYLLRLEPFTSLHIWLQDGKFDRPDRLFHSIEAAYKGCTSNLMDVKELIPEFYCNPEFLENINGYSLGTMQNGQKIHHVTLPPWARSSYEFIRINREALESDYVSHHLHHWIDLIFGYKQRPPHLPNGDQSAIDAYNCYMHFTYADAVDLEHLRQHDPNLYVSAIQQIENFGQTPMQLFDKPHIQRLPLEDVNVIWPFASIVEGVHNILPYVSNQDNPSPSEKVRGSYPFIEKPQRVTTHDEFKISSYPILFIAEIPSIERLVTVDSSRVIGIHTLKPLSPDLVPPYHFKIDPMSKLSTESTTSSTNQSNILSGMLFRSSNKERRIGVPFAPQTILAKSVSTIASYSSRQYIDLIGTPQNKLNFIQLQNERLQRRTREMSKHNAAAMTSNNDHAVSQSTNMTPSHMSKSSKTSQSSPQRPKLSRSETINSSIPINRNPRLGDRSKPLERVDEHLSGHLFAILPDYKVLFSCGHWDNSFKASHLETGKIIQSISHHQDIVTCLAIASDYHLNWLVTGSRDCTVMVWEVNADKDILAACLSSQMCPLITLQPIHVLYGHDNVVSSLAVSPELDLICSGSDDGTIILFSLRSGMYIRSIIFGMLSSPSTELPTRFGSIGSAGLTNMTSIDQQSPSPSISNPINRPNEVDMARINSKERELKYSTEATETIESKGNKTVPSVINNDFDSKAKELSIESDLMSSNEQFIAPISRTSSPSPSILEDSLSATITTPRDNIETNNDHMTLDDDSIRNPSTSRLIDEMDDLMSLDRSIDSSQLSSVKTRPSITTSLPPNPSESSNNHPSVSSNANPSQSKRSTTYSRVKRAVHMILITKESFLVAYSHDGNVLCTYSINGKLLRMIDAGERLYCMEASEDGKVLITGGERCLIVLRWTNTLTLANNNARKDLEAVIDGVVDKGHNIQPSSPFLSPIRSMKLLSAERLLIVGLESGDIRILAQDSEYLRRRLHRKLMEIGILPKYEQDSGSLL